MNKKWNIFGSASDFEEAQELLLRKRGFNSLEEAREFLNPRNPLNYLRKFPLEFKRALKDSKKLIEECVDNQTPIIIHGDYDADGICAASILYNYLVKERGYQRVFYFIPNRFDHGYGLSKDSIDTALQKVSSEIKEPSEILFITVDTGITSDEEVAYLRELGHKILITDHHQKPDNIPNANVVLWSDQVVGTTLAWILASVLGSKNIDHLSLAALATVTDVYPLRGINRALVKKGLENMNSVPPLGLKELISVSGLASKELDSYHLGWVLGPRINAAGRLSDASKAVELFTRDVSEDRFLAAQHLDKINRERQEKTSDMFELAPDPELDARFILVSHEDFHEGIIGLVASRLVRKHYRPSVVISLEDKFGKGSVRSIEGVNIIEILREFEELFVNLGGHPMAAGFTIPRGNIATLEKSLQDVFSKRFEDSTFLPFLEIDLEISLESVNWDLLNFISNLKPFGEGNRPPLLLTRGLKVVNIRFVGRDKNHVSLKLYDGTRYQKAIYFNSREQFKEVELGDSLDVVYSLKDNEYRGNHSLELFVKDIKKSK